MTTSDIVAGTAAGNIRENSLSIVVPAFNEEKLLSSAVEHLVRTAPLHSDAVEIIIVNDGSMDSTSAIANELAAKHSIVSAYHQSPNQGFGATVRNGFRKAQFTYVTYIPVDYHFSAKEFDIYLTLIKYADIVIGYRRERRKELGFYPWMVSAFYHLLVNLVFRLNFYDVNWIHLYRREQLQEFVGQSEGVFLLAETLIKAKRLGLKIVGVDVDFTDREEGVATGVQTGTIFKTIRELLGFLLK
jgi:glycosyltransferase involved in cell wall biosynthesis